MSGRENKKIIAILLSAMMIVTCMPAFAFADDKPSETDAEFTNVETVIDEELKELADEAVEQADEAIEKVEEAVDAVEKIEEEAVKAETTASSGGGIANHASAAATSAAAVHEEGTQYANTTSKAINTNTKDAYDSIKKLTDEITSQAGIAEKKADEAEAAKIIAEAATSEEAAVEAAAKAEAAAADAKDEADQAQENYEKAQKLLVDAKTAYENAVKAAQAKVDQYNTDVNNYKGMVTAAELDTLRTQFNTALANAERAKIEAETANDEATKAAKAATEAADKALNFYVSPSAVEYDAAKAKVDDLQNQFNTEKENKEALDAAEKAKIDAANEILNSVNPTIDEYDRAKNTKEDLDNPGFFERGISWAYNNQDSWLSSRRSKAREIIQEYNNAVQTMNGIENIGELRDKKTASLKAISDAEKAMKEAEGKLKLLEADLELAKADAKAKEDVLNGYKATRDSYAAALQEAMDKEAFIKGLLDNVSALSDNINDTQYDGAMYDWATDIWDRLSGIFDGEIGEAHETRMQIDGKYPKNFIDTLFNITLLFSPGAKTEDIIDAVEEEYFKQLLIAEEKLAMSQAGYAKTRATEAELNAAEAELRAMTAWGKVEAAKTKLEQAEATLKSAKEKIAELDEIKLSVEQAKANLEAAQKLVDAAKDEVDKAKAAASKADDAAKAARAAADKLSDISFQILLTGEGFPEGGTWTNIFGYVTIEKPETNESIIEGETTSDSNAVENRIRTGVEAVEVKGAKTYEEQIALINEKAIAELASNNITLASNQYIDWVQFESSDKLVAGEIVTIEEESTPSRRDRDRGNDEIIPEEGVPLTDLPETEDGTMEEAVINEEDTPLEDLPETGGLGMGIFLLIGAAVASTGGVMRFRKKED